MSTDIPIRRLLRFGDESQVDLQANEPGFSNDTNLFLIGTGTPNNPAKFPSNKTTGNFAYDANLVFTQIKIGGGAINGTPIGATHASSGKFSNVIHQWVDGTGAPIASNDPISQWRSSEVDHDQNINAQIDTTTYGFVERSASDKGGFKLHGLTEDINGMSLVGWAPNANVLSTKNASARAVVELVAKSTVSGDQAALTGNANAFSWRVSTDVDEVAIGFLTADGDLHLAGSTTITIFDDWDDVKLVSGLRGMVLPQDGSQQADALQAQFKDWVEYAREPLIQHGIISVDQQTGKVFVNMKRGFFLLLDAMRQVGDRLTAQEDKLNKLLPAA